jgi:hypothetical protein
MMLLFCLLAACGLMPEPTAIPIPTPRPPTDIPPPTPTGPPVYHWERFDVSLTVLINGDLRVVERHHLHFAGRPFTFGSRVINHPESGGAFTITDVSVSQPHINFTPADGQDPYTFQVEEMENATHIGWFFPPSIGTQIYEFRYTVVGGVQRDGQGDLVRWPAIPATLDERVEAGEILVTMPAGAEVQSAAVLYNGQEDPAAIQTTIREDREQATFTLSAARPAGDEVVVAVRIPAGVVRHGPAEPFRALVDPSLEMPPAEKGYRPAAVEHYCHGIDYFLTGRFDPAIVEFSRAIRLERGFAEAYAFRGLATYLTGDEAGAQIDFAQATALDPQLNAQIERALAQTAAAPGSSE